MRSLPIFTLGPQPYFNMHRAPRHSWRFDSHNTPFFTRGHLGETGQAPSSPSPASTKEFELWNERGSSVSVENSMATLNIQHRTPDSGQSSQSLILDLENSSAPRRDFLGRIQFTPGLDKDLEEALKHPLHGNQMALPLDDIKYLPSAWLDEYHAHVIEQLSQRRPRDLRKLELSPENLKGIVDRKLDLLLHRSHLHKLKIPEHPSFNVGPGEVFVRQHDRLLLSDGSLRRSFMSAWGTTNHGAQMAFLGLQFTPEKLFRKLMHEMGAQEYRMEPMPKWAGAN